jgi:hypothetical protein
MCSVAALPSSPCQRFVDSIPVLASVDGLQDGCGFVVQSTGLRRATAAFAERRTLCPRQRDQSKIDQIAAAFLLPPPLSRFASLMRSVATLSTALPTEPCHAWRVSPPLASA